MVKFKKRRLFHKYMVNHVFKSGKKHFSLGLNVFVSDSPEKDSSPRIGIIIRKKTGNSVLRNKLRRIFRSEFQNYFPFFSKPIWVLVDIPAKPLDLPLKILRNSFVAVLQLYTR